jgi:hypothetical protein
LTQALAILTNVADKSITHHLQQKILEQDNGLVTTIQSQSLYKFEAILLAGEEFASTVLNEISATWGSMLYAGATSFWETINGDADFDYAGSLSHGWSAIPAYIFQRYLLGIKPLTPGFKTFTVAPLLSVVNSASGTVHTPYGAIEISWEKNGEIYEGKISHPQNIQLLPPENRSPVK